MSIRTLKQAHEALAAAGDAKIAAHSSGFFKAIPGGYGEGDRFYGVRVPVVRALAKRAREMPLEKVERLLRSGYHEARLLALVLLCTRYERGDEVQRDRIYRFYLASTEWVNNWDLVDASAHKIVGEHLLRRSRRPLDKLARSSVMWERRIAMIATYRFIRAGELEPTWALAKRLLGDSHDLMHKAVGWMLREAGKRDVDALRAFLEIHAAKMPRTALRYSIEKLSLAERKRWLARGR